IIIYAISDCLMKYTVMPDYSLFQVIFTRDLVRVLPMLLVASLTPKGLIFYLKTRRMKAHAVRLVFSVLNTAFFLFAIQTTCLVNVYTMSYTTAIFTTVSGYFFLKEKVDARLWWAVTAGLVGVVIAMNPGGYCLDSKTGLFSALAGAFFASMNKICMRKLSTTEHSLTITIYPNLVTIILLAPFLPFFWKSVPAEQWPYFISIGVLLATAQYLIALALSLSDSSALAPLDYTSYAWVFALDLMMLGTTPTCQNLIGVSIIMLSGIYVYYRARRQERPNKPAL
ncbi:MAG: DMT family transporter, partial [Holosporales bacterium]|nr:DMT family transporter [Holosporales bacterium]